MPTSDAHEAAGSLPLPTENPDAPSLPAVSVIMPTCNRPTMLVEAIQSVFDQTYQNFEIIIVNDGGTDVESVLGRWEPYHKTVYIRHARNLGLPAARNSGLKLARGRYIAYLDDDDIYYPDHLQTLVGFLEQSGAPVAYSDAYQARQALHDGRYQTIETTIPYAREFDADALLVCNYIPVLCLIHARECLQRTGLFDEQLKAHEDHDLWIRMSRHYPFHHIPKATCEFRIRNDESNMTGSRVAECRRAWLSLYQKYHDYAKDKPHILQEQMCWSEQLRAELARLEAEAAAKSG